MTRFYDLTVGKAAEFERLLVNQGNLTAEDVEAVLAEPALAAGMVNWLHEQLVHSAFAELSELLISPRDQLTNMELWNKQCNWGFTESDFPTEIPDFSSYPLEVLVLCVYLPDKGRGKTKVPGFVRTANELWEIARSLQSNWWQWDGLKLDEQHLRLLLGTEERHTPGIRWMVVDLGANWDKQIGKSPQDASDHTSAHAEIFAAAAHFPYWVQAMNGTTVPYVWLAGYRSSDPDVEPWQHVPVLSFSQASREVGLGASWIDGRDRYCAVPVSREL